MQATYNPTCPRFPLWPILLAVVVISVIFVLTASPPVVDLARSHAELRHGTQAEQVRECIQRKGILQEWYNPLTNRYARVCQLKPTLFGLQIVQQRGGVWQEVTSFLKSKLTRLDQVEQYLRNTGYEKIIR